jgi:type IV pilus assembly protein PilQ
MSARLSSLLVAGGVVFLGVQPGFPSVAAPASESSLRAAPLQGATLDSGSTTGTIIHFDLPEFAGSTKVQVLSHPNRVVLDLHGVIRGLQPTRKDLTGWAGPLIQKVRLAQFATVPEPITRLVLEVADGTHATVSRCSGGVQLVLQAGSGAVAATVLPQPEILPILSDATAKDSPVVEIGAIPEIVSKTSYELAPDRAELTPKDLASPSPATEVGSQTSTSQPLVPAAKTAASIPSISVSNQPVPSLAVSTLMPAAIGAAQEKTPAALPMHKDETRGRTLGENQTRYTGSRITIDVKGAELSTFLRIIADHAKLNLVADQDVQGIYDFKFTDTPWDQVLDIIVKHAGLGMEINNGVIRVAKIEKLQKEEDDRKKLEESRALAGDLTTITRPLSFAKASEVKPIVEKMLTKRGSLIIDERTNVLIISDLPKNIGLIDDLIQQLDIQIQQVQIEARVVEANGSYEKAFGVKWPSSNSGDAKLSVNGSDAVWGTYGQSPSWNSTGATWSQGTRAIGGSYSADNSISAPAGQFWLSFLSNRMSINVILQALEKDGKIRIVSNPKVVTQNNKKAIILSGVKIPYPTTQSGTSGGAITVAFVDANLELDVTPQITNDGTIIMDLKIDKAEADFSNQVQGTPSILTKHIETQVLVRDGGTAVLGGIYTTNTNDSSQGVPFLSKIPLIGWLFRSKDHQESNTELLIFITPRVLKM